VNLFLVSCHVESGSLWFCSWHCHVLRVWGVARPTTPSPPPLSPSPFQFPPSQANQFLYQPRPSPCQAPPLVVVNNLPNHSWWRLTPTITARSLLPNVGFKGSECARQSVTALGSTVGRRGFGMDSKPQGLQSSARGSPSSLAFLRCSMSA
jgi:hypothetical protein